VLYLAPLAGRLAQLEERLVYTQEVGSSRLSPPTSIPQWLSLRGRQLLDLTLARLVLHENGISCGTIPEVKLGT
jgi:hypothetical protein